MSAETIAKALGRRQVGCGRIARCPAYDDQNPSLSIRDANGKALVRCHAGCDLESLIACLRLFGLWSGNEPLLLECSAQRVLATRQWTPDETARTRIAIAVGESAKSADGSLVGIYFASLARLAREAAHA
jgi:putative DNA primase/helicase